MTSLLDALRCLFGRITREEWKYRQVRRQSNTKWLREYARADKQANRDQTNA